MAIAHERVLAPDVDHLRKYFPALESGFAYLENAGGSQVPGMVADAIHHFMVTTNVQTGAGYPQSIGATKNTDDAHVFANTFMGGDECGFTILGHSTTAL